ncbi:MAG TPA: hypothetical protein VNM37_09395 [Candidatus Dormibacteraeota bacterium]|nr:hypothetical protein [Candidatus Dormibacteraeota bacterium]
MRVVEKYYSVSECALLLSVCEKTVLRAIKARELGDQVVNLGSEERPSYRIPAVGINEYLARRRVFSEPGVAARSVGELRRKAAKV